MYSNGIAVTTELVTQVAALLPGWDVDTNHPDHDVPALNGPDGLYIMIRNDYKGHYAIGGNVWGSGNLYSHLTYTEREGGYKLSINVAQTKTPKQIAADITRRLLPLLGPINARRIKSESDQATASETRTALLARLEQSLGCPNLCRSTERDADPCSAWFSTRYKSTYPRLTATANYQGTAVKLELDDISPDLAAAILALVASQQRSEG